MIATNLTRGKKPKFIHGLKLSELYYKEVVEPILTHSFPKLEYAAGLIGSGSEVLGYDTAQSMDHNWSLRLSIFLSEKDFKTSKLEIDKQLIRNLPPMFLGHATNFGEPDEIGVRLPQPRKNSKEVNHYIMFGTVRSFFEHYLGIDPLRRLTTSTWLLLPQQKLLEVTSGKLFHDDLRLHEAIQKFKYYPKDIWLYLMASQWQRISQEEAFVARTAAVGDALGSRIIASRIAKELMALCFLMERRYTPYSKWFGKAFSELSIADKLGPILSKSLDSNSIGEREKWLSKAYHIVAEKQNSLHITQQQLPIKVSRFYNRPYLVIHAGSFANAIRKEINDARVRKLPLIGSINQITENSELLGDKEMLRQSQRIYSVRSIGEAFRK